MDQTLPADIDLKARLIQQAYLHLGQRKDDNITYNVVAQIGIYWIDTFGILFVDTKVHHWIDSDFDDLSAPTVAPCSNIFEAGVQAIGLLSELTVAFKQRATEIKGLLPVK